MNDGCMTCVECGKASPPTAVWPPGWGCLFGCLAVCSRACAERYATGRGGYRCLHEGILTFPGGEAP
jgi:hypothetical protein